MVRTKKELKEIDFLYAKHNATANYKLDPAASQIEFPKYISKILNKDTKRTKREIVLLKRYRENVLRDLKIQSDNIGEDLYLKRVAAYEKGRKTIDENNRNKPDMVKHFGIWKKKSIKLSICRENYALIDKRSSFDGKLDRYMYPDSSKIREKYEDETCRIYTDQWCVKHREDCLVNFDLNMLYFEKLSDADFNEELNKLLDKEKAFLQIFDLIEVDNMTGVYVLVLDKYKQVYIGQSYNIKQRIMQHWNTTKAFDRLIFGKVETSILSIDSFGALDTTRIYVYPCKWKELNKTEERLVNLMDSHYMLNRTAGGIGDNPFWVLEVVAGARRRELK